ncbi:MAG: hypothetical protein IJE22_01520 [Oscillibacter sp.]|nr:hypothetical protein [Oscillibacter sp.]
MHSNKKQYLPPAAEVVLLAPCEGLAAWEFGFGKSWKNGYYSAGEGNGTASGIAMNGSFGNDFVFGEDGFFTKPTSTN